MPAENYVYLAGYGYDTIYIGYFAIRTYSSGLFIVTRSSPLDSWERMEQQPAYSRCRSASHLIEKQIV